MKALEALLREPIPAPPRDLEEHLARVEALDARFDDPVDRAAVGGLIADRLGYAFAAGYGAALQRLVPALGARRVCLAATESGGGHPRAIQTKLAGGRLVGTKTFATLAPVADELLVVASIGEREGKNELRVVRVKRGQAGVTIEPRPPWPVAPEIPHAIVELDTAVDEADVLPGDGYDRYLKPFRTLEDVHVVAATVGYLLGVGRTVWDRDVHEALSASFAALRALGAADPSHFGTHVALAGAQEALRRTIAALDWMRVDGPVRERWERDAPLLEVAGKARAARREAAWRVRTP
jgi:hypothetical protein